MKINGVTVPQPATKNTTYRSVLKSQHQLGDETGGFPPKGSSPCGVQPLHLVQRMSVPTGLAVTSPLHPFSVFPHSQPNPQLMPITYGKDRPIWLLLQKRWLGQENVPKPHQATGKHEQVWSWCLPGRL